METYGELAREFFDALDAAPCRPPRDRITESVRGEAAVLRLLMRRERELSSGEMSRALGLSTARVAAVLNAMERKGLLVRREDAKDRRRVLVSLTEAGEALCRDRRRCAEAEFSRTLERLGEEDATEFVRILRRVLSGARGDGAKE